MKNIYRPVFVLLILSLFITCKQKKNEKAEKGSFIPVTSIIKAQLNHIDTSFYSISKVTYIDSSHSDTTYIKREDIRNLAADFLAIPDLSKTEYTEENIPGPLDYQTTITYKPIAPDKGDVQRVDLVIGPDNAAAGNGQIQSIFIQQSFTNKDSSVVKKMLWQVNRSFQVTITRQLPGGKETYSTYKVIWNGDEPE
ncbi:MAG: hypothetical protein Q8941_01065 [Bacteroidota bacterium]|nr:hypothetical protein [Bacteroidota bacterium]